MGATALGSDVSRLMKVSRKAGRWSRRRGHGWSQWCMRPAVKKKGKISEKKIPSLAWEMGGFGGELLSKVDNEKRLWTMQLIRSEAVYQESMHKYVNKTHWAVDDRRRANRSLCIMLLPYFRCCVNRIVRFKLFPVEWKEEGVNTRANA